MNTQTDTNPYDEDGERREIAAFETVEGIEPAECGHYALRTEECGDPDRPHYEAVCDDCYESWPMARSVARLTVW